MSNESNEIKEIKNASPEAALKNNSEKNVDENKTQSENKEQGEALLESSTKKTQIINSIKKLAHKMGNRLKSKKIWIPLLIGHLLMFSSMGYVWYYAKEKRINIELALEQINKNFLEANAAKISSYLDTLHLTTHFDSNLRKKIYHYPDIKEQLPELPESPFFIDQISLYILDMIRGTETKNAVLNNFEINPADIATQLRMKPFVINYKKSMPNEHRYFIESTIKTTKFGTIPIILSMQFIHNYSWQITSVANMDEILSLYDTYYRNQRLELSIDIEHEKQKKHIRIQQFIKNPTCTVDIITLNNHALMLIHGKTSVGSNEHNILSWGVNIEIQTPAGEKVENSFFKTTGLYNASEALNHSWRISLNPSQIDLIVGQENALICKATPVYLNLDNGEFYDFSKKKD